jgi:hypothetical protein
MKSTGNSHRWMRSSILFSASLFWAGNAHGSPTFTGPPTATFGPGGTTVTSITIPGLIDWTKTPMAPASTVNIQYYGPNGAPVGGPTPTTVGPTGAVTVPPPPIPAGAAGLGSKLDITDPTDPLGRVSDKIVWYNSAWFFGVTAAIKIDPLGLPGFTPDQTWFLDGAGIDLQGDSDIFGKQESTVTASNFDVSYTNLGGGTYQANIAGDNSFMRLANGTYIGLPVGELFGTIQYAFNNGNTAGGTFNFSALGLFGSWDWSITKNYTGAISVGSYSFDSPAISQAQAPEPSGLCLGAMGLGCLAFRKLLSRFALSRQKSQSICSRS